RSAGTVERHLARIELGPGELPRLFSDDAWKRVAQALRGIGYQHVTLDLQGYRRGSTNEVLSDGRLSTGPNNPI
ncbi:MAG: hypothetical protein ACP5MD_11165, partial [Verrucomicrobiia bacterium]